MAITAHIRVQELARNRSSGNLRPAFTLVELMVVITILILLFSMLSPLLNNALQHSYKVRCLVHLGIVMKAHTEYALANKQFLPGQDGGVDVSNHDFSNDPWGTGATLPISTGLLYQGGYLRDPKIWLCPAVTPKSPGEFYMKYPWAAFGSGPPWTQADVDARPYTFHYSYNAVAFLVSVRDPYSYYTPVVVPNGEAWAQYTNSQGNIVYGARRLDSYTDPCRAIYLAEENTGKVPWDHNYFGAGWGVLNDPWFIDPDTTEGRHLRFSAVNYLDGHCDVIPPSINLTTNPDYSIAPRVR